MKLNREVLVNLRKQMIEYSINNPSSIEKLTDGLIEYPKMMSIDTDYHKFITRKKVERTGYGAFGESESDVYLYIKDWYVRDYNTSVVLDENDEPIGVIYLNMIKLIDEVKKEYENFLENKKNNFNKQLGL